MMAKKYILLISSKYTKGFCMNVFLHIDLNIFMIIICLIMYFSNRGMSENQMVHNKIFRMLILSNMILLALESVTWMLDGHATPFLIAFYYIVTIFLYLITPLPAALWALYVDQQLFHDMQRFRKDAVALGIPVAVSTLLTLMTPLTGFWFTIGPDNVYQRGYLYPLFALISFMPIIFASASILIHRNRISKRLFILMLLFMLPPVLGSVVQVLFYGTTLLWSSITVSIFLVHTNVQSNQIFMDHLTGVFNRRQLDVLLSDRMRAARSNHPLSCILLDINHFKAINDKLGHVVGDEALKDASAILKSCIRKGDVLARFGGDEFIILTDIDSDTVLQDMSRRIRDSVECFNSTRSRPYILDFSIGFAVYRPDSGLDKTEFIAPVDALMYGNKAALSELLTDSPQS